MAYHDWAPLAQRLEMLRRKVIAPKTWRDYAPRYDALRFYRGTWQAVSDMKPRHGMDDREYYATDFSAFRDARLCNDIADMNHDGWFTDDFEDATYSGVVLRLSGKNGKPRFVCGISHSDWDGVTIWPNDIYEDEKDAARIADRRAEIAAEEEREFQAEEARKLEIEELQDSIKNLRQARRDLIREMKAARALGYGRFGAICAALQQRLNSIRSDSAGAFDRLQKLNS